MQSHQKQALSSALATASRQSAPAIPLDWQDTTTPEHWKLEGKMVRYDWYKGDSSISWIPPR